MVFTTKALEGIMYWVPCIIIYDTVLHIIQYTLREEGKRTRDLVKWERKISGGIALRFRQNLGTSPIRCPSVCKLNCLRPASGLGQGPGNL